MKKVQPGSRTVPPEGFVFWETKEEAQDVTSKKLKPGDKIMIREAWAQKDENQKTAPQRRATVIKQYPHHVLVENAKGTRCCITNAEIMGRRRKRSTGGNRDAR